MPAMGCQSNTHQYRRQKFNGSRGPISELTCQLVVGESPSVSLDKPPSPRTHNGHVLEYSTATWPLIKPIWIQVQQFRPLAFIFRTQTGWLLPYSEAHEQIGSVHSPTREPGGRCTDGLTTDQSQRIRLAHDSRNSHWTLCFPGAAARAHLSDSPRTGSELLPI